MHTTFIQILKAPDLPSYALEIQALLLVSTIPCPGMEIGAPYEIHFFTLEVDSITFWGTTLGGYERV